MIERDVDCLLKLRNPNLAEHMERGRTKSTICLILVTFLVDLPHVFAQEGFLSLACGRGQLTDYTDANGIRWIPDAANISTGKESYVGDGESGLSLRYFPDWDKNCYTFEVTSGNLYLIRGTFMYYNYDDLNLPPQFDVAIDATLVFTVRTTLNDTQVHEVIVTAQRNYLNYCLLRHASGGHPVISYLELRTLPKSSYPGAANSALNLLLRIDAGNLDSDVRYPNDTLDRIWRKEENTLETILAVENTIINTAGTDFNTAPASVLANARVADNNTRRFDYTYGGDIAANRQYSFLVFLYFAELDNTTRIGDRIVNVTANGVSRGSYDIRELSQDNLDPGRLNDYLAQFTVDANQSLVVTFEAHQSSPKPPSLNAIEIYEVLKTATGTRDSDVGALTDVRDIFSLVQWSGDPCLPASQGHNMFAPWDGVTCGLQDGLPSIITLNLSNQSLQGSIPRSINFLRNLKQLILANNDFNELPDLSGLVSLAILDLRYNQLEGVVPSWLGDLPNLEKLLIDNNNFSGEIPSNLAKRNPTNFTFSFSGNPQLQGPSSPSRGSSTSMKILIGVLVGAAVFVLIMTLAILVYCRRKRRAEARSRFPLWMWTPDKSPGPPYIMKSPLEHPIDMEARSMHPQELSLKDVEMVTGMYKSRIGEGGFGAVYYGTLSDGSPVAVKVRSLNSSQGTREFTAELELLQQVKHENLVPLVGYCKDNQQQILVYPYMSNGSLHDRLHGKGAGRKPLDWQTRLNIVLGAARGLDFLHTAGERCIIHRDVKSSNILLDDSMRAKIADFGLSKYSPVDGDGLVSTEVRGTAGYLDPEYYTTQQLTEKSDVFSFGVVLLETVCGREPLNFHRPPEERNLLEWVRPYIKDSDIQQIVDPAISQNYTAEALWRVLEVALQSVEARSARRPTIAYIVRELEDALIIENNASQYMASIQSLDSLCIPAMEMKDFSKLRAAPSYLTFPFDPSPVFPETMDPPDPR